jgi:hypothetical protein
LSPAANAFMAMVRDIAQSRHRPNALERLRQVNQFLELEIRPVLKAACARNPGGS